MRLEFTEKITDLSQVIDKNYHIKLYVVHDKNHIGNFRRDRHWWYR